MNRMPRSLALLLLFAMSVPVCSACAHAFARG